MDYDWVYFLLKSKGFVHVLWRLKPYQKPGRNWKDCVQAALSDRVCLTIVGHYDQSPLNYDPVNDTGDVFPGKNKTEDPPVQAARRDYEVKNSKEPE